MPNQEPVVASFAKPWKWSDNGDQLIDANGRVILNVKPSDATEAEFVAIEAIPEVLALFAVLLTKAKTRDAQWREASELLQRILDNQ